MDSNAYISITMMISAAIGMHKREKKSETKTSPQIITQRIR